MLQSPPSRRRGLKLENGVYGQKYIDVASFSEAWIEIKIVAALKTVYTVASFSEAWIEITTSFLPVSGFLVASFSEAWIEIVSLSETPTTPSRLLLGGVD